MTIKEHLTNFHKAAAGFHTEAAKGHRKLAKCFSNVSKAEGVESTSDIADAHEGIAEQHISLAEFHLNCCEDLMSKAMGMGGMERDELMPDLVSSIMPEMPQHVRAVLRPGQREIGKSEVDADLEKLVSLD